jgi:anti-sigma-K factor RskA
MKCERIAELLPDYFEGSLKHEQDDAVEEHLDACEHCRAEVALWRELASLPQEQPSASLHVRFNAMLEAFEQGRRELTGAALREERATPGWRPANWFRMPLGGLAFSVMLLVAGFLAGRLIGSQPAPTPQSVDLTAVKAELSNMKQMVALTMLQQQSAGERLQGVSFTAQEHQLSDPKVISALLHTLRYDQSVDVRLAALDALARHGGQPQIRSGLLDALDEQQSPLVQVALIDQMVEMRDRSAVGRLQKLQQEPGLNPAVQQRAAWAIGKLNF